MPTHYNVKMKMLYALAICGLVRRDDLAIFSETMNAGSHDIMDLISAGFVKESSAEVDIRIGGRSGCAASAVSQTKAWLFFWSSAAHCSLGWRESPRVSSEASTCAVVRWRGKRRWTAA